MKTQWQNPKRGWARALSCLLAFVLVCGTVLAAPPLDGAAWADPNDPQDTQGEQPQTMDGDGYTMNLDNCRLTVQLPAGIVASYPQDCAELTDTAEDAHPAIVDMYKVADAIPVSGYDVYEYCVGDQSPYYEALQSYLMPNGTVRDGWRARVVTTDPRPDTAVQDGSSSWLLFRATQDIMTDPTGSIQDLETVQALFVDLAQQLTTVWMDENNTAAPDGTGHLNEKIDKQQGGLYLVTVHDSHSDLNKKEEYTVSVPQLDNTGKPIVVDGKEKTITGTVAYTSGKYFIFEPQLVSLPGREIVSADGSVDGNTQDTTTGRWTTDLTVVSKPTVRDRYASLEVTKHLRDYSQVVDGQTLFAQPVTVVFRVQATDPNTNEVKYEQIIPMSFSALGTQTRRLDNVIPVGSTVTVTEEYPGSNYVLAQDGLKVGWKPLNANDPGSRPYDENPAISNNGKTITLVNIQAGLITLTTPSGGTVVLEDGSVVQTEFTNVYRPVDQDGGSAVNSYLNSGNGWTWKQLTYDPVSGQWVEAEQPYDPSQNNPNTPSQGN